MNEERKETDTVSRTAARIWLSTALGTLRVAWPLLLVCVLTVFLALHYVRPAPPKTLTIASGAVGSRFQLAALQYQRILARSGINLKVLTTEGSLDNLDRLRTANSGVDIALVQSGLSQPDQAGDLVSLGSLFYVPLTIFYRSPHPLDRLSQLHGHRIAIGPEGSGTRTLAMALLRANEIEPGGPTELLDLEGAEARSALLSGKADAVFLTGDSATPETIREMLHAAGIRMFDFPQADAYVRRFTYLSKLDVPPGAFDLGENLPPEHLNLLASTIELVGHSDLHPALSDLLIEAATEVHGHASLLAHAGEFPSPRVNDFPISADAMRYYKSGKSFAYRYLPFWLASLLDRALVVMLPALLVIIPIIRYIPEIYNWNIRRRINRRYGQLMALERQSLRGLSAEERAALIEHVAKIEKSVIGLKLPGSHATQLFTLRQHLQFVRDKLTQPEKEE
jgi:TRAP-type uncharacterized transport system substrate-binding protein